MPLPEPNKKETILVVEDEANSRLLLKTYLLSDGYEVQIARNGPEALKQVAAKPPSAIILDVVLPKMDGFEVCRKLRNLDSTRFIPIILVTALRGDHERTRGIEVGADDFIGKPFNRVELLTRMKSLLRIRRLHQDLQLKVQELEKVRSNLRKLAVTDGLTGLFNYRAFRGQLHLEVLRAKRFNLPFSVLMIDIDHFKVYNDSFGHPSGDRVLKRFAQLVRKSVREVDTIARYGGEEFVVILPGTDKKSAVIVAEKLRKLVEKEPFPHEDELPMSRVTISLGVTSFPQDTDTEKEIIRLMDQAMYKAKNNGRNRTAILD